MSSASPPRPGDPLRTAEICGVRFHVVTEAQAIAHVLDALDAARGGVVVTPNLDHLRRCARDAGYREIVGRADLVVADGMPLIWASRIAGRRLPERVAGSNLVSTLSAAAGRRGRSVYLLGGAPGTAEGAARVLAERCPGLRIAGTWFPPYGFDRDEAEMAKIVAAVTAAAPDIVYVGLGSPRQELLIERLRDRLPRSWWLGVGISFSFLTGDVPRAPRWMRACGLEWLHRLWREPARLGRRYLVEGIPFGVRLFAWSVAARLRGAAPRDGGG